MVNFLVRYGPAPANTTDSEGNILSQFTNCTVIPTAPETLTNMLGTDGTNGADPDSLVYYVAALWKNAVATGHGHMLVGVCLDVEYAPADPTRGAEVQVRPTSYAALYSVMRYHRPADSPETDPPHVDFAVDYRGTTGPGDTTIRPVIFVA